MYKLEIWKNIDGFKYYQISNLGNIKSLERTESIYNYKKRTNVLRKRKEKILATRISSNGYLNISLLKNGKTTTELVHRLVAEAFIPNPDNLPQVNHINGNKQDNRVENLEWCTPSENLRHAVINGLKKSSEKQKEVAKKNILKANDKKRKQVEQLTLDGKLLKTWNSMTDIYNELNYRWGNISAVCRGKKDYAYGYKWKYRSDINV